MVSPRDWVVMSDLGVGVPGGVGGRGRAVIPSTSCPVVSRVAITSACSVAQVNCTLVCSDSLY